MANRWCDGFGRYGGTKAFMLNGSSSQAWAQVDAGFTLSNANPRTGLWNLRMGTGIAGLGVARRVFGAPLSEVLLGKAIFCRELPSNETSDGVLGPGLPGGGVCLFGLQDQANNQQCGIWLGTD